MVGLPFKMDYVFISTLSSNSPKDGKDHDLGRLSFHITSLSGMSVQRGRMAVPRRIFHCGIKQDSQGSGFVMWMIIGFLTFLLCLLHTTSERSSLFFLK